MSDFNVIDFKARSDLKKTRRLLEDLTGAGLSSKDISILTLASNRAFSSNTHILTLSEAGDGGFDQLRYLRAVTYEIESGTVFEIGPEDREVISYLLCDERMSFNWFDPTAENYRLSDQDDPGLFATNTIINHLNDAVGLEEISLWGFLALDIIYFACNSTFQPLGMQIFPKTNLVGLIFRDPERDTDIILMAQLERWAPDHLDLAQPAREPNELTHE